MRPRSGRYAVREGYRGLQAVVDLPHEALHAADRHKTLYGARCRLLSGKDIDGGECILATGDPSVHELAEKIEETIEGIAGRAGASLGYGREAIVQRTTARRPHERAQVGTQKLDPSHGRQHLVGTHDHRTWRPRDPRELAVKSYESPLGVVGGRIWDGIHGHTEGK